MFILYNCVIIVQYKGVGTKVCHVSNELDDAIVTHDTDISAAMGQGVKVSAVTDQVDDFSIDHGTEMTAAIGQGAKYSPVTDQVDDFVTDHDTEIAATMGQRAKVSTVTDQADDHDTGMSAASSVRSESAGEVAVIGQGAKASHVSKELADAIIDHDMEISAALSVRPNSVDDPVYVPVIGQGDRSMEVYCTMPNCYMGESIVPQDPYGIKPPRLPLNHPPSKSAPGRYMTRVQSKSRMGYIFKIFVIGSAISVIIGSYAYIGIIVKSSHGAKNQTHEGKELLL